MLASRLDRFLLAEVLDEVLDIIQASPLGVHYFTSVAQNYRSIRFHSTPHFHDIYPYIGYLLFIMSPLAGI